MAYAKLIGETLQIVLIGLKVGAKTGSIVFKLQCSFAAMLQNKLYVFVACFIVPEAVQDYLNTD